MISLVPPEHSARRACHARLSPAAKTPLDGSGVHPDHAPIPATHGTGRGASNDGVTEAAR